MIVCIFKTQHNPLATTNLRACLTDPLKGGNPYNNRRYTGYSSTGRLARPVKTVPGFFLFSITGRVVAPYLCGVEAGIEG
jgi:hypothetical protein